jgi:hypothetical protein
MIQSISWSGYFNFLLIVLLIYYPVIGLFFYRKELAIVIKRKNVVSNVPGMSFPEESDDKLLEELRDLHRATSHHEFPKEELILILIQKLKQYHGINKELVNQFIGEAFPQLEEQDRRRIGEFIS